jgi:hypothetical protein
VSAAVGHRGAKHSNARCLQIPLRGDLFARIQNALFTDVVCRGEHDVWRLVGGRKMRKKEREP